MRKVAITVTTLVLTGLGLVTTGAVAAPAGAAPRAPHACSVHWGSQPRQAGVMVGSQVRSVRAGQHACFDRLVIDIGKGAQPGYRVRYVRQIVQDPSGRVIKVRGHAKLLITVLAPAARTFPANSHHLADVAGFASFRQVAGAGSFEGLTSVGVGIRAKLPFRVIEVHSADHRTRLVVDVAHHW